MKTKVIIGMSGGVDSSVSAYLLTQQGFEVEGLFMKNWEQDDTESFCPSAKDLADAKAVCEQLDIPLHQVNFSEAYWQRVFSYFLDEYAKARTPNPDILCNKEIKFKAFLDHALTLGADYIATGHYARVEHHNGIGNLFKAKDRDKDQTYFLHAVERAALGKALFPLAGLLKSEVREIATSLGLATHAKKDSTGICFIGERRFKTFLSEYMLAKPGPIITTQGLHIGKHDGLMFYTIGQRQGLGIGGGHTQSDEAWYVVGKQIETNALIVAQGQDHPLLFAQGLICGPIHWLSDQDEFTLPLTCYAKTRYRQNEQACMISPENHHRHTILFSTPQRAITPGQYIVFYDKNRCIGGATIEETIQ